MDDNHTLDELAETYNRRLVGALKGQGALTSPLVENAFLSIPRHAFIDSYYVHDATSTETEQWRRIEHPAGGDIAAWLEGIYANVALVTAFDEAGSPSSSSSSPDIMAFMLEALRLGPGMRVLEIGTGTGYNAALLASIVGDLQLVFSVELEPSLAHAAQQRLDSVVGKEVQVKGSVQTWERLLHAYQEWVSLGQPKMADYVFEVDEEGEQVIRIQDNIWELSS